jgi:antitoxin HicB
MARAISSRDYVREILNTARYQPCEDGPGFVAVVDALPGCMAQGSTLEDTRDLLIGVVETWLISALEDGEALPVVNGCASGFPGPDLHLDCHHGS